MQTFGQVIQRFNLGGTVKVDSLDLKENKDENGAELTMDIQNKGNIEKSRQAKEHFFTQENQRRLESKFGSLTKEEKEELQDVSDGDVINWFNRTKLDDKMKTMRTIPGAFVKSRAHGAASI